MARLMLVASSGGHLTQLLNLWQCWAEHDRHWVTFDKPDAISALRGERVSWAHHPVTRNLPNAVRNLRLALRLVRRYRPDAVISSGAGVAVPFFLAARLLRVRTVYLEAFERFDRPSLAGLLCYPFADQFCLQWTEQRRVYPDGMLVGAAW